MLQLGAYTMCSESSEACNSVRYIGSKAKQAYAPADHLQLTVEIAAQLQKLIELELI